MVVHLDVFDGHVLTGIVVLHPDSRIAHRDTAHGYPLAGVKADQHGAGDAVSIAGLVGEVFPLSVDGAAAGDADIDGIGGENELRCDGGAGPPFGEHVMGGIGAAQQFGALLHMERDTALQYDGACHKFALGHHHAAAAGFVAFVDGLLDGCRAGRL